MQVLAINCCLISEGAFLAAAVRPSGKRNMQMSVRVGRGWIDTDREKPS